MSPAPSTRRPGFTLVELLIVIALIAILLALSASATMRVIDVQRGSNTEQTVKIVSEMLDREWAAEVKKAKEQYSPYPIPEPAYSQIRSLARNDEGRIKVIWIKLRLKQVFPMTFEEALNPAPLPALPTYTRALTGVIPDPEKTKQSSVCLLLALQQSRGGSTFDADSLGSGAVSDSYCTRAGAPSDLKQIVDGFANPLAFFRWATANADLNPGGPLKGQPGFNDPVDVEGKLADPNWLRSLTPLELSVFEKWIHKLPQLQSNDRAHSFKLLPVVVSAGRNGFFGYNDRPPPPPWDSSLLDPTMAPSVVPAHAEYPNDNIYSYRLRFGARGD